MGAAEIIRVAVPLAEMAVRAIEAANDGDEEAAREYLRQARQRFDEGSRAWDDAAE